MLLGARAIASAQGQPPSTAVDSLLALLQAEPRADTVRVRRLQALAELLKHDPPQAIARFQQSLRLARRLKDRVGEGQALLRLGTLHRRQAQYPQALEYTRQAQRFFRRTGNPVGLAQAYLQRSLIENVQGNPTAALEAALQALHLAEQTSDLTTQTRIRATIASIYVQLGDYQNALPVLQTVLQNGQQLGDQKVVASAYNLLGHAYQLQQKWPQARAYYRRSAQLNRHLGDTQNETIDETDLAALYEQQGLHAQALRHGARARQLALAHHDEYNLPTAELVLAQAYLATRRPDSAIALAAHGLRLSQQRRSNENIRTASHILAQAYAARGDSARAYRYHTLYVAYKDTLAGEETQRKTSAMRYGYELDKQRAQITALTQARQLERQKRNALLGGLGGLVALAALLGRNIVLKQRANRHLNEKNQQIKAHRDELKDTLTKLKATQQQLIQSEKLVALAALTAGVAHEIQNPLNFVNNFSEVSLELVDELQEEEQQGRDGAVVAGLLADLKQNLVKIHQHGTRADRIVKGMLEHARSGGGERQPVEVNALATEYLRLAYHDAQAKHPGFVVTRTLELDPHLGELTAVPQELGRVLLNVYTNAFYALWARAQVDGPTFMPEVRVHTRRLAQQVELHVRDNGGGIPAAVVDKVFEPFFTTKPPGEGTGLGLSLSHDIVTKGYGGALTVDSQEGAYTEFTVLLPLTSNDLAL
ncbi:tetratricopeptide repeat protein [Hymenobacter sp. BT491]|nr:tetratricopeptide repeat protein [Hymenobacter sp. BT491]